MGIGAFVNLIIIPMTIILYIPYIVIYTWKILLRTARLNIHYHPLLEKSCGPEVSRKYIQLHVQYNNQSCMIVLGHVSDMQSFLMII